jgi:hypothetical protein
MALQLSTGLRNKLLDTAPFRTIFNLGFLNIYANNGALPVSADAALVGGTHVLLVNICNNNTATGITFAAGATNGVITKNLTEVWSKVATFTGTGAFWRLVTASDTGALSTVEPRIQGTIGLAAADLNVATVNYVNATVYTIDAFSIGIPTL